jgi:dolichol-phosphate mannosyltransferase
MAASFDVSVVVPVYDERDNLVPLHDELCAALGALGRSFEIVFVDDGSTDGSDAALRALADADARVTVLGFRRNFGQTAALSAGIEAARGAVIVPIDADLQNDPADIPRLIARLDEGCDVVSGWRRTRADRALTRRLPSVVANRLISWISGVRLHDYGCTLKAYRRDIVQGVRLYGEMHRFIPIYAAWQGARVAELEVNHRPRRAGASKYGLSRVAKVLLDLIVVQFLFNYLTKPIYVFGGFGLLAFLGALGAFGLAVYFKLAGLKDFVSTPLPLLAGILGVAGLLCLLMGLLAEVCVRTYFESQGIRPYGIAKVYRPEHVTPGEAPPTARA